MLDKKIPGTVSLFYKGQALSASVSATIIVSGPPKQDNYSYLLVVPDILASLDELVELMRAKTVFTHEFISAKDEKYSGTVRLAKVGGHPHGEGVEMELFGTGELVGYDVNQGH